MKVNFFATFRPIVGGKTVEVDVTEGATLQQLLKTLVSRFPTLGAEYSMQTVTCAGTCMWASTGATGSIWPINWRPRSKQKMSSTFSRRSAADEI